jgi:N-acetyl-anhydromuramyl-L-alanine amidase AmpD
MSYRVLILLAFCATVVAGIVGPGASVEAKTGSLDTEFDAAARKYEVPKELLLAMGYVNTRWEMPPPEASDYEEVEPGEGAPEARGSYGIMQLVQNPSEDTLGEAATLTGISEERLKKDRARNIRGGAAVLAQIQGETKPEDLNEWYEAVAEYGGGPLYAEQVYEVLKDGAFAETSAGEKLTLEAQEGVEPQQMLTTQAAQAADYSGATWYGASSYNYTAANRPSSNRIDKIIVHVTQGSWSSAINAFQNSTHQASAHYTVRSSDGFVGQSVREKDIAWHAGNWPYNQTSIGIEHEGYVSDPKWFTDAMYRSSAKLSAYLAKKYGIPIDRNHIIGHVEVPYPNTHYDPGSYWDWNKYMSLVRQYAGGTPTNAYSQIIDNANPNRFYAASNWGASSYSSQRYGSNYKFASPGTTYNGAKYRVKTPTRGNYAVYAWWASASGYNDRTVFWIWTTSGWASKTVSQRTDGSRWMYLGTYKMGAWDDWNVEVSNQSSGAGYVIADAVKVVRQ